MLFTHIRPPCTTHTLFSHYTPIHRYLNRPLSYLSSKDDRYSKDEDYDNNNNNNNNVQNNNNNNVNNNNANNNRKMTIIHFDLKPGTWCACVCVYVLVCATRV